MGCFDLCDGDGVFRKEGEGVDGCRVVVWCPPGEAGWAVVDVEESAFGVVLLEVGVVWAVEAFVACCFGLMS